MPESTVYLLDLVNNNEEQNTDDEASTNHPPHQITKEVTFLRNRSVRQIACGVTQTVFVLVDGSVYSYENNEIKNDEEFPNPKRLSSLDTVFIIQAACGDSHSVVISNNGKIMSWGRDTEGQCGRDEVNTNGRSTPRVIKSLSNEFIVQVACGSNHTVALAKNGKLYAWGDNSSGQLGFSSFPELVCAVPTQVSSLNGLPIQHICCGGNQSLAVMFSGSVFGWGCNQFGQLGEYDKKFSKTPQKLELQSRHDPCKHVSAGEKHSVFVSKNGGVVSFGRAFNETSVWSNKLEELSKEKDKVITSSKLHSIIFIPSKDSLYVFGPTASSNQKNDLGESDRTESNTNSFRIFESLSSHINMDNPMSLVHVYGGGNLCYVVTSDPLSQMQISQPSIDNQQMIYELNEDLLSQLAASTEPVPKTMLLLIQNLFSTASCLNRSFLTSGRNQCCEDSPGLDISRAKKSFKALSEKHHVLSKISEVIHTQLCPSLSELPLDLEALRIYLLLLEFPTMQYPELYLPSIYSVAKAYFRLSPVMMEVVDGWLRSYSPQDFEHLVVIFKHVVIDYVGKVINANPFPTETDTRDVTIALDMLNKLYRINEENNEIIPYTSFYIHEIKSLFDWSIINGFPPTIAFKDYPCVLVNELKVYTTIFVNMLQKGAAMDREMALWWMNPSRPAEVFPNLVLNITIDRHNIISSTITEFNKYGQQDFMKPLKVTFKFEPGQDDGALSKEFFQLIFNKVLDPKFGMFKVHSKTEKIWFNPQSFEDKKMFRLVGILCGLAIYNQVIVDLPFPEVLYKKLLKKPIYLSDIKDLDPTITESLQGILDYDDFDLQDVYDVRFEFSSEFNKEVRTVELKEGGSNIPLTYDNKHEYVNLYLHYLLNKSVKTQYDAFEEGFLQVFDRSLLDMFHPQELMLMIIGNKIYDWEAFEHLVEYRGDFSKEHQTIKFFWEVFHDFEIEEKKKFLEFLTGSDRISIHGMSHLRVIIEPPVDDDSTDLLPTAQTCYNRLFLPLYETKEKMKEKLLITLENSVGFGLV